MTAHPHPPLPPCPDIGEVIERANRWLRVGRPIIKAWFALDDAEMHVRRARLDDPKGYVSYRDMSPAARDWEEAQSIVSKARDALDAILDGIRENAICDECIDGPSNDEPTDPLALKLWDAAWEHTEEFNNRLRADVLSVDAAIKIVKGE